MGNRGRPPFKRWEMGKMRKLNKLVRRGGGKEWKKGPNAEGGEHFEEWGCQSGNKATGSLRLSEDPLGSGTGSLLGGRAGGTAPRLRAWSLGSAA